MLCQVVVGVCLARWDDPPGHRRGTAQLAAFTAEKLGDVPLKDQRAKGELLALRRQHVRWPGAEGVAPEISGLNR